MIKRINLIEKPPFAITLQKLLQAILAVVLLNVALVAWQAYKLSKLAPELSELQNKMNVLKEEKKSLEKKPVIKKKQETVQVGEYQDLFEVLGAYPKWAGVVGEITANLPNAVWLTAVTSEITGEKAADAKQPPANGSGDQAPATTATSRLSTPAGIKLTLTGLASDVDGLSVFIKNLQTSNHFSKTVIQGSQRQSFGFEFTITSELSLDGDL